MAERAEGATPTTHCPPSARSPRVNNHITHARPKFHPWLKSPTELLGSEDSLYGTPLGATGSPIACLPIYRGNESECIVAR